MILINNKKGNTLLIVVIATFVLLSIALYLNKFVINQIKISNDIDKIKIAEYAAESGVERTLFLVNKNGISLDNVINNNSYNTAVLNNNSSYKIIIDNSYIPTLSINSVAANTNYSLDVTSYISNIKSFSINWSATGNELVYVSIARYMNNTLEGYNFRQSYNHFTDSPAIINININPVAGRTYKFEINPINYNAININTVFYSAINTTGNYISVLPGQSKRIRSVGNIDNNNKSVISDFLIDSKY